MAVAASLALARPSTKLARPGVPNVVVTHPGGSRALAHTLKPRLCVKVSSTLVKTYIVGFKVSEEEAKVLPPGFLVVHDAPRGGQHHLAKLSEGQQVVRPLLNIVHYFFLFFSLSKTEFRRKNSQTGGGGVCPLNPVESQNRLGFHRLGLDRRFKNNKITLQRDGENIVF